MRNKCRIFAFLLIITIIFINSIVCFADTDTVTDGAVQKDTVAESIPDAGANTDSEEAIELSPEEILAIKEDELKQKEAELKQREELVKQKEEELAQNEKSNESKDEEGFTKKYLPYIFCAVIGILVSFLGVVILNKIRG